MNRWLNRGLWLLLLLVVLGLAALVASALFLGEQRAKRRLDIQVQPVALRSDAEALARGRYLYGSRGCVDCHGAQGQGATLADDGKGLKLAGPNLTRGNPVLAGYQPQDWVRSIRHGVGRDGRALRLMPSEDYNRLTDGDLASLVAYVQQLPAQPGNEQGVVQLPLPGRVMYGLGQIPEAAYKIDHSLPPSQPVPEAVTVEHGAYIAQMCVGCHGVGLRGGRIVGAPPDWPAAARLAPGEGSVMPRYPQAETFVAMMRSGKREDGSAIGVMPFSSLKTMNDTDLRALHLYLKQLGAT